MKKSKVFVVDSHELVRLGMQTVIKKVSSLQICGESGGEGDTVARIKNSGANLVLMDIRLHACDGLQLVQQIRKKVPSCKIVVCSMRDEVVFAEKSIQCGAQGFVSKAAPVESMLDCIDRVLQGELVLGNLSQENILYRNFQQTPISPTASMQIANLSQREFEVFEMIGVGKGSQEIADRLDISAKTVEAHRQNIRNKLGLRNMAELVCRAAVWVDKY